MAELAMAAGLALESVVDLGRLANRLAVGDAWAAGPHRSAELALEPFDEHVHVGVAHSGQNRLAGAVLTVHARARLLLEHALQGLAELVEICLALRLDAHLQRRL